MDKNNTICVLLERNDNIWSSKVVSPTNQDSPKLFPLDSASPKSPQKDQSSLLGLGVHFPLSFDTDKFNIFSWCPDQETGNCDLFDEESSEESTETAEESTETAEEPLERSNISKTML